MKNYDALFVLQNQSEEGIRETISSITRTISKHKGKIEQEENWGKKGMAFPIKKEKQGIYYKLSLSADPLTLKDMEGAYGLNSNILRVMVTKKE